MLEKSLQNLEELPKERPYIQRLFDKRERSYKRSIDRDKKSGQLRLP